MCMLKQPTIVAKDHMSDDIEKLIGFILHGVTHQLHDGLDIPKVAFVVTEKDGKEAEVAIVNYTNAPSHAEADRMVQKIAFDHNGALVASMNEAWALPEDKREAQRNGTSGYATISEHPDKYECLILTVEAPDGVWMGSAPFVKTKDKRKLPDEVHFELLADEVTNNPSFTMMLPPKAPPGAYLH